MPVPRKTITDLAATWPIPEGHKAVKLNVKTIDAQPYLVCLPPHPFIPTDCAPPASYLQNGQAADIWEFLREHRQPGVSIYWSYSNANVSGMGPAYEAFSEDGGDSVLIPIFAARQFRVSTAFHLCFVPLDMRFGFLDIHDIEENEQLCLGTLAMSGKPVPRRSPSGKTPRYINNKKLDVFDTSLKAKEERIVVQRVGSCFVSVYPLLTNVPYEVLEMSGLVSPYA